MKRLFALAIVVGVAGCTAPAAEDESLSAGSAISGPQPAGTPLIATAPLNVRAEPDTSSAIIAVLPAGSRVTSASEEPRGGYYEITWGDTTGWVYGRYLERESSSGEAETSSDDAVSTSQVRIAEAAARARGMSTSAGPDGGNNACLWAVNRVLRDAGVRPPWGGTNYVPEAQRILAQGSGTPLDGPEPGAIVIFRDYGSPPYPHVGIVLEDGSIISNSSSRASFSWVASAAAYTQFYGRTPLYYSLK